MEAPNYEPRRQVAGAHVPAFNRRIHIAAWAAFLFAFPLVWMGGLVTSTGAGLAVPDWPNSFGYNMFALPWEHWIGRHAIDNGVFYEHSHRLLGSLLGIVAIWLHLETWYGPRRSLQMRWVTAGLLGAIIFQGLMGGLRVTELNNYFGWAHGIFGQCILAFAGVCVVLTSKPWTTRKRLPDAPGGRRVLAVAAAALVLVVIQLALGAAMRHDPTRNHHLGSGAGLAIPDFPLHYGRVMPPMDPDMLPAINMLRAEAYDLPPVTFRQIHLHMGHRIGAVVVSAVVVALAVMLWRRRRHDGLFKLAAGGLVVLLLAQLTLGVLTVLWRKPADIATLHQAVGSLLLVTLAVTLTRAYGLYATRRQPAQVETRLGAGSPSENPARMTAAVRA
ncbi:MAG: heme A synthase [Phycisphaerae bacterium]